LSPVFQISSLLLFFPSFFLLSHLSPVLEFFGARALGGGFLGAPCALELALVEAGQVRGARLVVEANLFRGRLLPPASASFS
jgi:hypothetical protein